MYNQVEIIFNSTDNLTVGTVCLTVAVISNMLMREQVAAFYCVLVACFVKLAIDYRRLIKIWILQVLQLLWIMYRLYQLFSEKDQSFTYIINLPF